MSASRAASLTLVVNPFGGGGRGRGAAARAARVLRAAGREVALHETRAPGHARALAATLPLDDDGVLVAVGGDGTFHELCNGVLARTRPVPVALVPAGSGDALARDLGLDGRDAPERAARRVLAGARRALDVVRVTCGAEQLFAVNVLGFGLVGDVAARAERLRRLGPRRYRLASLLCVLRARPRTARVTLDDEVFDGPLHLLFAGNTRHTGAGMRLVPEADPSDGWLDVLLVPGVGRLALLRLLARVDRGTHLAGPLVVARRARRMTWDVPDGPALNVDGEVWAPAADADGRRRIRAEVLPGALELLA
ncbi:MAG: hypothetical protein H6825_09755 [Planctomycetes bacterium]|nr:hypothetical protein [Planctomycetota bacterium]